MQLGWFELIVSSLSQLSCRGRPKQGVSRWPPNLVLWCQWNRSRWRRSHQRKCWPKQSFQDFIASHRALIRQHDRAKRWSFSCWKQQKGDKWMISVQMKYVYIWGSFGLFMLFSIGSIVRDFRDHWKSSRVHPSQWHVFNLPLLRSWTSLKFRCGEVNCLDITKCTCIHLYLPSFNIV